MKQVVLALLCAAALAACGYPDPYATSGGVANESPGPTNGAASPGADDCNAGAGLKPVVYPDGLKIIDLTVGTGQTAKSGDQVTVQYTGWLTSCKQFDTSRQAGRGPFAFQIGISSVIQGWHEGVVGMKVGGKRKLIIPSELGYGTQGSTDPNTGAVIIPPNADLIFDIELLSAEPGPSPSPSPSPTPTPTPSATPSPTK